jgi:hypothetical protein
MLSARAVAIETIDTIAVDNMQPKYFVLRREEK